MDDQRRHPSVRLDFRREAKMRKIYYPDHDQRYSHIPKSERCLYPDELYDGWIVIKRTKLYKDITGEDIRKYGVPACLIAKDVPYTEGLHDG